MQVIISINICRINNIPFGLNDGQYLVVNFYNSITAFFNNQCNINLCITFLLIISLFITIYVTNMPLFKGL